jgi:hypothetical protein
MTISRLVVSNQLGKCIGDLALVENQRRAQIRLLLLSLWNRARLRYNDRVRLGLGGFLKTRLTQLHPMVILGAVLEIVAFCRTLPILHERSQLSATTLSSLVLTILVTFFYIHPGG